MYTDYICVWWITNRLIIIILNYYEIIRMMYGVNMIEKNKCTHLGPKVENNMFKNTILYCIFDYPF